MRLFVRAPRVLLLALLAFVAWPVGSALADTTVGQTGAPGDTAFFGGQEWVQTSYGVPAGGGTITSLQTESSTCQVGPFFLQGTYDLQVLRPQGGNQYLVLGDTGNQTDPCDSQLHSYAVNIPVQPGDVLGAYAVSDWVGVLQPGSGSPSFGIQSEPRVGQTVTVPNQDPFIALDESATLSHGSSDAAHACQHGGYLNLTRNDGSTFANVGDCVSYFAQGGTLPSCMVTATTGCLVFDNVTLPTGSGETITVNAAFSFNTSCTDFLSGPVCPNVPNNLATGGGGYVIRDATEHVVDQGTLTTNDTAGSQEGLYFAVYGDAAGNPTSCSAAAFRQVEITASTGNPSGPTVVSAAITFSIDPSSDIALVITTNNTVFEAQPSPAGFSLSC